MKSNDFSEHSHLLFELRESRKSESARVHAR